MRIQGTNDYDGGGRSMLTELLIEGGGELASITITQEHIVGRRIPFTLDDGSFNHDDIVIWIAIDVESLNLIPSQIRDEVLQAYQAYRKKYKRSLNITDV